MLTRLQSKVVMSLLSLFVTSLYQVAAQQSEYGTTLQFFPQIAINGGATTSFLIHNATGEAISVKVELFQPDGTPLEASPWMVEAAQSRIVPFGVPGGTLTTSWAKLSSDSRFAATELLQIRSGGNQVEILPSSTTNEFRVISDANARTQIAIVNPNDTPVTVTIRHSKSGRAFDKTLAAMQQQALSLDELFQGSLDDVVAFSATQPIAGITLRLNGDQLAALPVITGNQKIEFIKLPVQVNVESCEILATDVKIPRDGSGGFALDGDILYWFDPDHSMQFGGSFKSVSRNGGAVRVLASVLGSVSAFATDATHLYWTENFPQAPYGGAIRKIPKAGGSITTLAQGVPTGSKIDFGALGGIGVDGDFVYWAQQIGPSLRRVPKNGGPIADMVTGQRLVAFSFVIANGMVYGVENWGAPNGRAIRMSLSGGAFTVLAGGLDNAGSPVVNDGYLYWADNVANGRIARVSVSGGAVTTLAANLNGPHNVAVEGQYVYYPSNIGPGSANVGIFRVGKNGGPPAPAVACGFQDSSGPHAAVVVDSSFAYFINYDNYSGVPNFSIPGTLMLIKGRLLGDGLSLHRVEISGLMPTTASDNAENPLIVRPDASVLKDQPMLRDSLNPDMGSQFGLVADGVTPLLFKFTLGQPPPTPKSYEISFTVPRGSLTTGDLAGKLRVLTPTGTFISSTTLVMSSDVGFAYLAPIKAEELNLDIEQELFVSLNIREAGAQTALPIVTNFRIRKPPIILVHGYNSNSSSWDDGFLTELKKHRPDNFWIIPVDYGVTILPSGEKDNSRNLFGRLDDLARQLSTVLDTTVTKLRDSWAFTRYDVVGHSQGGLLLRVLSSEKGYGFPDFRSPENFYRGRFHRIVTIGSPHNGSLLLYYLQKLLNSHTLEGTLARLFVGQGIWGRANELVPSLGVGFILQSKFDPFGSQIQQINNDFGPVDENAMFRTIRTTIYSGAAPGLAGFCPLAYFASGLCIGPPPAPVGYFVIPRGSDGIADYDSQGGGPLTKVTELKGTDISHSEPKWFFGSSSVQPASADVARAVSNLLEGPLSNFGKFGPLPLKVLASLKAAIDSSIPEVTTLALITRLSLKSSLDFVSASQGSVYSFALSAAPLDPIQGQVNWYAEVFGPSGVSSAGVTVQVNANDSRIVSVVVDDALQGDVVLYSSYISTVGRIVFAKPIVVVSRPTGTTLIGIELVSSTASLLVGDKLTTEVWGIYSNGTRSRLYIPPDNLPTFISSNPSVLSLDTDGSITAKTTGSTTITVSYQGFTSQLTFTVQSGPVGSGILRPRRRP